jgi:hypothetical protein
MNQHQSPPIISNRGFRLLGSDAINLLQFTDQFISLTAACGQVIVGNTCQVMLNHGSKMRHRTSETHRFIVVAPVCALKGAEHTLYQATALSATVLRIGAQPARTRVRDGEKPLTGSSKNGKVYGFPPGCRFAKL